VDTLAPSHFLTELCDGCKVADCAGLLSQASFSGRAALCRQATAGRLGDGLKIPTFRSKSAAAVRLWALVVCLGCACATVTAQTPAPAAPSAPRVSQEPPRGLVTVEVSEPLFVTMCALYASGFDANETMSPAREQLSAQLRAINGPAAVALRRFYQEHALGDSGETLSRFVSYALVVGPAPKFEIAVRQEEIPPGALALEGFGEVLSSFYAEAELEGAWQKALPSYEKAAATIAPPVSRLTQQTFGYLRDFPSNQVPRTFTIYVEPLIGGKTNFHTIADRYAFVFDPNRELPEEEIRHALLHFMLDPLAYRYLDTVDGYASLLDFAARAPRLPVEFHADFPSFLTECLVLAVELRMQGLSPSDLEAQLASDDADGLVLVRPLVAQLMNFEKSKPAMSLYYPDLIRGIDLSAEWKRDAALRFAPREYENPAPSTASSASAEDPDLAAGEQQIAMSHANEAAAAFQRVLAREPNCARALYGLAIASLLQSRPELAEQLFLQVIAAGASAAPGPAHPDAETLSWSHVYLGRLYDVAGNRDQAVAEYQAALAVKGAPDSARAAAQRGIEQSYQTPKRGAGPGGGSR
jgi:hypothetical protein